MITRLKNSLPNNHLAVSTDSCHLYIVDYKDINNGEVSISYEQPAEAAVYITNPNSVPLFFMGFKDNALVLNVGQYCRQCECVLFPQANNDNDWILFVEMKYVDNITNAFRASREYPWNMIDQIIQTVGYFRNKGIIGINRRVTAILSFPKLIEDFSASFFTGQKSVEDILLTYKILIRATNSANIISSKRIVV